MDKVKTSAICLLSLILISGVTQRIQIRAISFIPTLEFFNTATGKLQVFGDPVDIISIGDVEVLKLPFTEVESKLTKGKEPGTMIDSVTHTDSKYEYVINAKNHHKGLFFKSITDPKPVQVSTDSVKKDKLFPTFPYYQPDNDRLIYKRRIAHSGDIMECHIYRNRADSTYFDSIYYYFNSRYNHLNYTLSAKLDSLRGLKLYKAVYVYNPRPLGNGATVPKRRFTFEIKPYKGDLTQIAALVERYKAKIINIP